MADLQEGEIWAVVKGKNEDSTPKPVKKNREHSFSYGSSSSSPSVWRFNVSPRAIPRGKSPAKREAQRSSAPIDIPDWSSIYGKNSKKGEFMGNGTDEDADQEKYEDDEDEDNGEIIPPHEYIARRLARNNISSHSVCEGNGRTLKGRDLRTVRNAILTKTGFLE